LKRHQYRVATLARHALLLKTMPAISPQDCAPPLVVAIDIGTSSARATLFDGRGRNVEGAEARAPYAMKTTADGGVEISAEELIGLVFGCLDQLHARIASLPLKNGSSEIRAVSACTFWHGLLGVDRSNRAITPLYSWNDTRASADARDLKSGIDEGELHARTGCRLHASYWPAKLAWLRRAAPELFNRVERWMSIGEYLHLRLFGQARSSVSMASATGLFNQHALAWDEEALSLLEISAGRLPALSLLDEPFTGMDAEHATRWPRFSEALWFPAFGDGACNNIGSGCATKEQAALMVGTSGALRLLWQAQSVNIPRGLWCYRADHKRFVMGGALSNGGDLFRWMTETLRLGSSEEIESSLAAMDADAHGLTTLPFLSGERSTGWHADARAVIVGMSLDTTPLEILRSGLESVAYRFCALYDLIAKAVGEPREVITSGAALLRSPTWAQIICDVIGREVVASREGESSSRGAALLALEHLGAIPALENIEAARGRIYSPDPKRHARYAVARKRQEHLYDTIENSGLWAGTSGQDSFSPPVTHRQLRTDFKKEKL
jgi:gluconokinase